MAPACRHAEGAGEHVTAGIEIRKSFSACLFTPWRAASRRSHYDSAEILMEYRELRRDVHYTRRAVSHHAR